MSKSNFQHDLKQEQILGKFLDKGYRNLFPEGSFVRVTDNESQHRGIDLIYLKKDSSGEVTKEINIDEKAQSTYLNKDLPTFAFELSYVLNNNEKQGWLFDSRKDTDYYFLITSIHSKNNKSQVDHQDDIDRCTLTKIKRASLINNLSKLIVTNPTNNDFLKTYEGKPLTDSLCLELSENLRLSVNNSNDFTKIKVNADVSIFYTGWLKEKPINLVIYLNYLKTTDNSSCYQFKSNPNGTVETRRL